MDEAACVRAEAIAAARARRVAGESEAARVAAKKIADVQQIADAKRALRVHAVQENMCRIAICCVPNFIQGGGARVSRLNARGKSRETKWWHR